MIASRDVVVESCGCENQNQALFSLLGTTFGGNGQTTFALPNLQGRVPIHVGANFVQIRLVDIALLPRYRGLGFGGALLKGILAEGAARGKAVTIHVEANNPAMSLYRRFGFRHVDSTGIYFLMRWTADAEPARSSGSAPSRPGA